MYAYFKSSLNILISKKILSQYPHVRENTFSISSKKILSQYPHVRDCPSLPPLIQRNKIRPAFYFFTPGKVLKYI